MALEQAFQVDNNGISLDDNALIATSTVDPKTTGYAAPVGSFVIYNGVHYRKFGANNTDWYRMLDELYVGQVKAVYYRQNLISPGVMEWNDTKAISADGTVNFYPTLDNTATGVAIFTTIYNVQLTCLLNSTVITDFTVAAGRSISADNKVIACAAAKNKRTTIVLAGTVDGLEFSTNTSVIVHCKITGV